MKFPQGTELQWWYVNISSGNGLGVINQQAITEPIFYDVIWHKATMSEEILDDQHQYPGTFFQHKDAVLPIKIPYLGQYKKILSSLNNGI